MNLISKAYDNHFIINAVWHFLLLHGLLPEKIIPAAYTIMGQSWSLTLEWQFYIVIPFIRKLVQKEYSKKISVLLFLMIFILIFFAINYMPQNTFLPNMIHYFMIGYFSYSLYKREDKRY
ncbi:Acyltransferase family protein [compost metagenome]